MTSLVGAHVIGTGGSRGSLHRTIAQALGSANEPHPSA